MSNYLNGTISHSAIIPSNFVFNGEVKGEVFFTSDGSGFSASTKVDGIEFRSGICADYHEAMGVLRKIMLDYENGLTHNYYAKSDNGFEWKWVFPFEQAGFDGFSSNGLTIAKVARF